MRSWTVQTEKYVIQDAHGYSCGKFGWPEEVVWPRISAEEQGGWSWHWWGGLHAGWHFQVSFGVDSWWTLKRNVNILLFRIRDETLLFLQQFGKSDRAVISGVIIFYLTLPEDLAMLRWTNLSNGDVLFCSWEWRWPGQHSPPTLTQI